MCSHPDPTRDYGENEIAESKYGYGDADIHPSKKPTDNMTTPPSQRIKEIAKELFTKEDEMRASIEYPRERHYLQAVLDYLDEHHVEKDGWAVRLLSHLKE